jgi:hypothetical protein
MGFTREDMAAYEKQPQTQVADTQEHLLKGATLSKTATAADVAAATTNANADANPSSGDGSESDDQTVTGNDGTSDENADSSTASAEPGSETETSTEGEGGTGEEEPVNNQPPPKKGSAAARIQELLDLTEGYKEFGKHVQSRLTEALAENARLKSGGTQAQKTEPTVITSQVPEDEPMPDLSDPDVNFDTDKLRAKTAKWVKTQVANGVKAQLNEHVGKTEEQKILDSFNANVEQFAASHPDWETKVAKNPVLLQNQLLPVAARTIAKSEYAADILYEFGNDPGLAVKTAKKSIDQQIVTIGEVIAKIKAAKAAKVTPPDTKTPVGGAKPPKQKSLTNAPPPPSATKAAGRADPRDVTDPNMDMDEFARRHREGKQAGRNASRKARGLA